MTDFEAWGIEYLVRQVITRFYLSCSADTRPFYRSYLTPIVKSLQWPSRLLCSLHTKGFNAYTLTGAGRSVRRARLLRIPHNQETLSTADGKGWQRSLAQVAVSGIGVERTDSLPQISVNRQWVPLSFRNGLDSNRVRNMARIWQYSVPRSYRQVQRLIIILIKQQRLHLMRHFQAMYPAQQNVWWKSRLIFTEN